MLVRAIRGIGLKLMCLLVCGLWSSAFIPTCFHVLWARVAALLSFRTAPIDLILSRAFISDITEDFLCFVLSNQRLVNGWEDNHGHSAAFKVTGWGLLVR